MTNKELRECEILAGDFTVNTSWLHYNDILEQGKDRVVQDLMSTFSHKYLDTGFAYKCMLDIKYSINEEQSTEKVTVRLYFKKDDENE